MLIKPSQSTLTPTLPPSEIRQTDFPENRTSLQGSNDPQCLRKGQYYTVKAGLEFAQRPGLHRTHLPPASGSSKQLMRGPGIVEGKSELCGRGGRRWQGAQPPSQGCPQSLKAKAPPLPRWCLSKGHSRRHLHLQEKN